MNNRRHDFYSYAYAWFLVFITPIGIPLAIWTAYEGWVTKYHIITAVVLYSLSAIGITVGFHRMTTHRAFQAPSWLKRILLICGCIAMQGSPAAWASIHIQHHAYSDKEGDPHSPVTSGFWYSHCGWVFRHYQPNFKRFGKWLLRDNDVRHVSKYYLYYSNLGLLIPFLLGGWVGLVWGGLLRLFCICHMTWSINSVCHYWGQRFYPNTPDKSTNHPIIAFFTFGEGWHNNHHRYMQSAYFGHRWYQLDMGKWLIMALAKVGLVDKVKTQPMPQDKTEPLLQE